MFPKTYLIQALTTQVAHGLLYALWQWLAKPLYIDR